MNQNLAMKAMKEVQSTLTDISTASSIPSGSDFAPEGKNLNKDDLKVINTLGQLTDMPHNELKSVVKKLEKDCFLCDSYISNETLSEDEHWHLVHCTGTSLSLNTGITENSD